MNIEEANKIQRGRKNFSSIISALTENYPYILYKGMSHQPTDMLIHKKNTPQDRRASAKSHE
jgi:hypothetical protein